MNDYKDMERLLDLIAETQEMQLEPDALSELLSESMPEEIPASDMELISAAGSSEFAEFMKLAEENGTYEKIDD